MNWDLLPFGKRALKDYLTGLYSGKVRVKAVRELKNDQEETKLKAFGYGNPLLVRFEHDGTEERVVLHTMPPDHFGHERISDRARNLLLDYATFNALPGHVPALDVGAFSSSGELLSLGEAQEFFLLTQYARGRPYAHDLERIAAQGNLSATDEERAIALAAYLSQIHAVTQSEPALYRRRLRDLVGHGEGIMGILDSYPPDLAVAPPARLAEIERRCVTWRWRAKDYGHRLAQVHGDFHPWNVLFDEHEFVLLDRSRGAWGEPADDVSAMSINFILFSLRLSGRLEGAFGRLYDLFWQRYLEQSGDEQVLEVIQPFYAWRALVLASPVWYPSLPSSVRETLLRFAENLLQTDRFDPPRVNGYLA